MPLLTVMCSNLSGQLSNKTNFIGRSTQHGRMSSLMWQWEDCTTNYMEILRFFKIKILSHVRLFVLTMLTARRELISWLNTRMYKHIHTFVLRGRCAVGNIFCFIQYSLQILLNFTKKTQRCKEEFMITRTHKINEGMTFNMLLTGSKPVGLRNLDTLWKIKCNFVNQWGK